MSKLNNNELATIRIALLDKIDDMGKYIKMCEEHGNVTGKLFWEEAMNKHRTLLNKLYDMQIHNQ